MSGSAGSTYESCLADLTSSNNGTTPSADVLLQCIANTFDDVGSNNNAAIDTFFLIYAASLVFFMQTGFAMICAGCVRINNVQNTLLKNLLDACGASLGFYMVGYAFAFGGSFPHDPETSTTTFIGTDNFFLMGVENDSFWLFQFAFCATCATIVAGTLAERCQMTAYLAYSVMLSAFVYPVVVHSIWSPNGFLAAHNPDPLWGVGMVDFAGSAVVHLTGGMTALIATKILGPRTGRFYDLRGKVLEQPKEMPGHSLALQCLGVSIFLLQCG
jgi:Amt family ammonium transporter